MVIVEVGSNNYEASTPEYTNILEYPQNGRKIKYPDPHM
jgi:hypothetical protein